MVKRNDENYRDTVDGIAGSILNCAGLRGDAYQKAREDAWNISRIALWKNLVDYYRKAYDIALSKARKVLDEKGADQVSLIITGGLRVSSDFAKALAMGADAIAIGTAAMMAVGCQQYRICDTGKCPVGIATQDPALRARLDVEKSAARVANFFRVNTDELSNFARLTGNEDVHGLSVSDLCTTNSELSNSDTLCSNSSISSLTYPK